MIIKFLTNRKKPKSLSRQFACVECKKPIHEAKGESNHFHYEDRQGFNHGPYHKDCLLEVALKQWDRLDQVISG